MKILVVEPYTHPYEKEIDGTLESMQEVVEGYIQAIYPFEDETVALICNEEGKLNGLPYNRALRQPDGKIYDIIAGTFFLCSAPSDREGFESLRPGQVSLYKRRFKNIELYL